MNETLTLERKRLFMQKWDSRPEKPDNMQWTVFVITLVIIAAVMVYGLLM
ncbi:hypothetical protein [Sporosarcina ureae]|nr:hypothetical protein [Sporosarcina ureae]